jgi:hypothetical protein
VGRKQFAVVIVVLVALAVAAAVAAASRRSGNGTQAKPLQPPAMSNGLGDDNANLMRRLQRQKLAGKHK